MGIVLRGGTVFDPVTATFTMSDLRIDGTVAVGSEPIDGDEVIDASGCFVTPGLVDLHVHVFDGQDLGIAADTFAPAAGTTTVVDAGSAGAHLIGAFRKGSVERATTRVLAFLNISSIGTTSTLLGGELLAPYYADVDAAVDAIEANRDLVVGVKVRASSTVGGEHTAEGLRRARRAADRVGLPLMVHMADAPVSIDEILDVLRAGDILTHAFNGWPGNTIVEGGELRASARRARDRGVLFDIGHGLGGLSLQVARTMLALGELPDTISSDFSARSASGAPHLHTVLSKFLALGMGLPDVLRRATLAPATAVGLHTPGTGSLRAGAPGDVAAFRLIDGPVEYADRFGGLLLGEQRLECVLTITGGTVVFDGLAR